MSRPACLALACLAVLGIVAATVPALQAQNAGRDWETLAGGDEVLALSYGDDGRLYVGTEGGGLVVWNEALSAFDQYLFPTQSGLPANDVRAVALDPEGEAWLATPLGVTHARGSSWRTYGTADGLPSLDITALAVDAAGVVWAGTHEDGIASFDPRQGTWVAYEPVEFVPGDEELQDGPGDAEVTGIAIGADGRVWVAHGRSTVAGQPALSVFDPIAGGWRFVSALQPGEDPSTGPVTDQVLAVEVAPDGTVWLGTWSRGVLRYDEADDLWTRFTQADGLCGDNVWAMDMADGEIWVTCEEGGAAQWDGAEWTAWPIVGQPGAEGVGTNVARSVAVGAGEAFLGLNGPDEAGSGVLSVVGRDILPPLTTAPETPWSNDITAIAIEPDTGVAWVGTRGAGLMRYDGAEWDLYTEANTAGSLPGNTVTDLLVRDDELWVATTKSVYGDGAYVDGGVAAIDTGTLRWTRLLRSEDSDLPDDDVSSLALTADGRLWIGMGIALGAPGHKNAVQDGNGIAVYDPDADRFETFYQYLGGDLELSGPTVLDLAARGEEVWAATSYATVDDRKRGGGVSRALTGAWESWTGGIEGLVTYHGSGDPSDVDPFITGDIRSVLVEGDGRAWAGTWDLSVGNLSSIWPYVDAVVNEIQGGLWTAESFDGDGWVPALAVDSSGNLWAATTRGHEEQEVDLLTLRRADTARGGIQVWNERSWVDLVPANSGVASNAITALAVDPTTGHMWVGTENNGLSIYRVGQPRPTETPCVNCPTATPRPTATATVPLIATVPSDTPRPGTGTAATAPPGLPTMTPLPGPQPPPEVPEASTLLMFVGGIAALVAYFAWRRWRGAAMGV